MIKYFTYQFEMRKYQGYRLLLEKSTFASFKKIECKGFQILYATSDFIHYQIDSQLIRKIKLNKINDGVKKNSTHDKISRLLEGSEEKEDKDTMYSTINYWTYASDGDIARNINEELLEKRARDKYHAKMDKNLEIIN